MLAARLGVIGRKSADAARSARWVAPRAAAGAVTTPRQPLTAHGVCGGAGGAPRRTFAKKAAPPPPFEYQPIIDFEKAPDADVTWRKLTSEGVEGFDFEVAGEKRRGLRVSSEALAHLSRQAFIDISFLLRTSHLEQVAAILDDPEASANDRFVALQLLKNATVAAGRVLPSCQDTGTATVIGYRGGGVFTDGNDESDLSRGVYDAYTQQNLRYSQMAPLSMYEEKNTGTNLPAQVDLYAKPGSNEYKFMFVAKGGGSANKMYLFQETKALLNPETLMSFIEEKTKAIGTAACPPYHLALVVGGTSADACMKTLKLATTHYLDGLPTSGNAGGRAFRDIEMENAIVEMSRGLGIGAQFGGKYFLHDCRVVRLPRHGASCPVALGVSCSADRQVLGKITEEGVFIEQLETDPARLLHDVTADALSDDTVKVNLDQPMDELLAQLRQYTVKTRLSLTGTLIVARDIAHARLREIFNETGKFPDYMMNHPVYYAGPAKKPDGMPSGSFGPTTASRMDPYAELFMKHGASMISLAKGNRTQRLVKACKDNGGFYLGSIGGPAAILAQDSIKSVEVLDFEDLGMEAVWKITVEDFPAFIIVDHEGNDFFSEVLK